MLNLIGTGLSDFKDLTLKAKELIDDSDIVYIEVYTSKLKYDNYESMKNDFKKIFKKELNLLFREDIENNEEKLIEQSKKNNVSILVIGDAISATTHIELILNAKKKKMKTNVVHNASVFNAIAITGLQLYKFGKTASIIFPELTKNNKEFIPETPYKIIQENLNSNAHTLLLLDIKINKETKEFMAPSKAIEILKKSDELYKENYDNKNIITDKTKIIVCSRLGESNEKIIYAPINKLIDYDFGEPLHCIIIPSALHFIEEEMLEQYELK